MDAFLEEEPKSPIKIQDNTLWGRSPVVVDHERPEDMLPIKEDDAIAAIEQVCKTI